MIKKAIKIFKSMIPTLKSTVTIIKSLIPDIIACLGAYFIFRGVSLIHEPAGFITLGILIITGGVIISKASG